MKVALGQIAVQIGDLQQNLDKHLALIREAVANHADLIVFPELSLTGDMIGPTAPDNGLLPDGDALKRIAEASKDIDIVIGAVERSVSNLYNRYNAAFYFSEGLMLQRHRKLFLVNYSVFEEAKHYVPGNNLQSFVTHFAHTSLLVCNDVWHAAAPYIAALDGAELMLVPSNSARGTLEDKLDIPRTWENMNRTYSATMGFYTVFVNCVGTRESVYGDYQYWGGSEIIAPTGEVVVKAPYDEEALVYGEIDIETVARQRFEVPLLRDARIWLLEQEFDRLAEARSTEIMLDDPAETLEILDQDGVPPTT
jgi:predicted amidohydrolase